MHWYTEMKVSGSVHALVYRNEGGQYETPGRKRLSGSEMKFIKTAGYRSN